MFVNSGSPWSSCPPPHTHPILRLNCWPFSVLFKSPQLVDRTMEVTAVSGPVDIKTHVVLHQTLTFLCKKSQNSLFKLKLRKKRLRKLCPLPSPIFYSTYNITKSISLKNLLLIKVQFVSSLTQTCSI